MKVRDGLQPLRSGWWLAALGVLLGLAAAQLVIHVSTPLYESSTELFVGAQGTPAPTSTDPLAAAYTGSLFTQQRVASYVQFIQGERLSSEVIDELGLPMTPGELTGSVTGTVLPSTVILRVSVTDPSPRRAQAIAASYGRHFITDVTALEKPDPASPSAVKVSTVEAATYNPSAVSPNTLRDYGLGALLGLLLGLALAALRWRTRATVQGVDDVEAAVGAPALAAVTRDRRLEQRPFADLLEPNTPGPEEIRQLRIRIDPPRGSGSPGIVVVTSAERGAGATTVAAQLATALARAGRTVLLVDADLRHPALSRQLDLSSAEGLADVLAGTADETAVIRESGAGRPAVLAAGNAPEGPESGDLFAAPKMRALLDTLCSAYDAVVIDAPPVLPGGEVGGIGALADGCLLVTRYGSTRRNRLAEAARTLSWYGVDLLGAVLTGVPERRAVARGHRLRYAPDPARTMERTGTVSPTVPFDPAAAPRQEEDQLSPTTSPAGSGRS